VNRLKNRVGGYNVYFYENFLNFGLFPFLNDMLFTKLERSQVCGDDIIHFLVLTTTATHI
jgi:hypothetical protein